MGFYNGNGGLIGIGAIQSKIGVFDIITSQLIGDGLYAFTDATFTPGGATFQIGPTLTQARTGLTGTGVDAWKNNTTYFNTTTSSSGIMLWVVPASGVYTIDCYGAQGANQSFASGAPVTGAVTGGLGARIKGDFNLIIGQVIALVVGQQGQTQTNGWGGGGGGGGTFAWVNGSTSQPLIAAGGGGCGGAGGNATQAGGQTTTSGSAGQNNGAAGGVNGATSAAAGICGGGSGQGWLGGISRNCGGNFTWPTTPSNPNGHSTGQGGLGGFGGGGGSYGGGGGGGGYSGGGSAGWSYSGYGGGGGSYNTGTNQLLTANTNTGSGKIIITRV
jgi:hypothetical protein